MSKLTEVVQVKETSDLQAVNAMLDDGWILIDTYTIVSDEYLTRDLTLVYSLGKLPA